MKVLWLCNIMLPVVAQYINREASVKEGWLSGLAESLVALDKELELVVAFPVSADLDGQKWEVPFGERVLTCYGFYENTLQEETHDESLKERLSFILAECKPDMVHCFGTEYDHVASLLEVWPKEKTLIGFQGVCGAIAKAYYADLPAKIVNRNTFRDWLKKDNVQKQKEKFDRRASREESVIAKAMHVTGRTNLDKNYAKQINPSIVYHGMNETLRTPFYEGLWHEDGCQKHSIFVSQGDYPIKGLHYVLLALPMIAKQYPDVSLYVAGNSIVKYESLLEKIKISSYGKYLRDLMTKYKLESKVTFLGRLEADKMKERMLKSHLFLCCSAMENSPNSLGEAMLLGVPCVAADVGGVPDLFVHQEDGLVYEGHREGVETFDEEGVSSQFRQAERLSLAVLSMWGDKSKQMTYCENARQHAGKTHDGVVNAKRLLEIYHLIVN